MSSSTYSRPDFISVDFGIEEFRQDVPTDSSRFAGGLEYLLDLLKLILSLEFTWYNYYKKKLDRQNKTARKELPGQGCNRATSTGLLG